MTWYLLLYNDLSCRHTPVYSYCNTTVTFLFSFFLCLRRKQQLTPLRLMRIDGPRTLNFLCSVVHHSTHTIFHFFFHTLPCTACIECRFQMLTGISQVSIQGRMVVDGRFIINTPCGPV